MNKGMNYLALARKAQLCEAGEEPVGAAARAGRAYLIVVASDASDHTWRRANSFAAGTQQQCIRLDASKEEMGMLVGRSSLAVAAITDPALALAMVRALDRPERYQEAIRVLTERAEHARKRRSEAEAHRKNVRKGSKNKQHNG